ncbi:MAG: hypothetical protein ACAH80_10215 [Alphaproteobacteria bacterium]
MGRQAHSTAGHDRRLWIIELDPQEAHIYERTIAGTRWMGDVHMDCGHFCLDLADKTGLLALPDAPEEGRPFLASFARWLDMAEEQSNFDKAVVVASTGTLAGLRPALSKRADTCVKLAPSDTLVKNASEDCLAHIMWH